MAGPKRGDVTKGIINGVMRGAKEVTRLSAEQLSANVRAFKERQERLRASADARRRDRLRRMTVAKGKGRGLPKRGDVKKRIGKELVEKFIEVVKNHKESEVKELSAGILFPSKEHKPHCAMSMHLSRANSPVPGVVGLSGASKYGASHELVEEPMQRIYPVEAPLNHGSVALPTSSSATSSLAIDSFLQASPLPTKKEVLAKQWPKVDMSRALVHKGSVLFEEQKGKWAVMESCSDEAAGAVIPLTTPSLRVATPLQSY